MLKENAVEVEELQSGMSNSANKESDSVQIQESASAATKPSDSKPPASDQEVVPAVVQRATGPRSLAGKQRSSRNSIKHGIFSSPLLLGEENAKLYRSLLKALDESVRPEGMLESVLVEKLATIVWRHRRLLQAESAEILKNIERVAEERADADDAAAEFRDKLDENMARTDKKGLIVEIDDRSKLQYCLQLLREVQMDQRGWGFECGTDWIPLGMVYGARYEGRPGKDLYDFYRDCRNASIASEEVQKKNGFASKQDCLEQFSAKLDGEIRRLEGLRKETSARQRSPRELKPSDIALLACKVPGSPELDRLLRYEASLERSFDRTLSQLERLQRLRLGQPGPPSINLNVSSS